MDLNSNEIINNITVSQNKNKTNIKKNIRTNIVILVIQIIKSYFSYNIVYFNNKMQKAILYLKEYSELINEIIQLKEIKIFIEKYNKEVKHRKSII